jgi:hypothetical protein
MSDFKRVKDVHTGAEYHAPVSAIEKWPEDYKVLDDTVVHEPAPATPAPPKRPARSRSSAAAKPESTAAAAKKTSRTKPATPPAPAPATAATTASKPEEGDQQ